MVIDLGKSRLSNNNLDHLEYNVRHSLQILPQIEKTNGPDVRCLICKTLLWYSDARTC